MDSFDASSLLSESAAGECSVAVFVRKHNKSYVDDQNWCRVPTGALEAGVEA